MPDAWAFRRGQARLVVPTWGNMAPDLAGVAIFCTPITTVLQNGEGGVGQTVAAPMASWGEEAARLAQGRVPCGLHQF